MPSVESAKTITIKAVATTLAWSLLILLSVIWNVSQIKSQVIDMAMTEAKAHLAKDRAFRKWASDRGGVYVAVGEKVQPSPYLAHVPMRDIQSTEGLKLTLKNPAMVINEIMADQLSHGVATRITGTKYLNPADAPDEWEKKALAIVESSRDYYHEVITIKNKPFLRMMQPMIMEESCLMCHSWTGIRVGELRGATDVAVPLDRYLATAAGHSRSIQLTHAIIWLLGMAAILFITKEAKRYAKERLEKELLLNEKNAQLESEIDERKKTELQLTAIFDFLPDATFVVDKEQRVIAWNRAIEQLTGVSKAEIIGQGNYACTVPFYGDRRAHLIDLITVDDDELAAKYKRVTRKDGILYAEAFTPALFNGKGAYVWAMVAPLYDQNGERTGAIESIRDVTAQKNLENELRDSHQHLFDIIDFLPDATMIINSDGRVVVWSREMTRLTGVAADMMVGRGNYEYALPFYGDRRPILVDLALNPDPEMEARYTKISRNGDILYGESFVTQLKAKQAYLVASASTLRDSAGKIVGAIECIRDHTEQMKAQERINLLAMIFENSGEGIVITDYLNRIIETNKSFSRLTGYSREEALGENPRILKSEVAGKEFYEAMWSSILGKNYWQGEVWDKRKNGTIYPKWLTITAIRDDSGEITNFFASFSDISERKEAEQRIEHLAHTDALTSLPNRHTLVERLSQALEQAKRSADSLAVLFIDLDRFKTINDSLGHHIGDLLLIDVAVRLKKSVRSADIVARFGGDEFVVILPLIRSEIEAAHIAEHILTTLSEPYILENNKVYSTPSIGISIFPHDGTTVTELFKNADSAMYSAKSHGRNNFQMFTREMHTVAQQRLTLETDLRTAIEKEEFIVHYQPQIDATNGSLAGFEALVRWQSPERGIVPPDSFIPVAEETGLIIEIGRQVLHMAFRQMSQWQSAGLPLIKVAINLSARQLRQPELPETISELLKINGISPNRVELEVTESMVMGHPEESIKILTTLKKMGIDLAIDDFGTGYSSLSYLKLFPVDTLKIDRSFVKDIETDPNDAAIASATIALAHTLGRKVVAEGVETGGQLEFLKQHGCDIMQGYLFSKPLPADKVPDYIKKNFQTMLQV